MNKLILKIWGIFAIVGAIVMVSTVGASDMGTLDHKTFFIRAGVGVALFIIGLVGLKKSGWHAMN